ncbi:MAG: hypothetical protein FWD78_04630 [Treponema sp.]|nr:hypothetical protein [Treponema sp.]
MPLLLLIIPVVFIFILNLPPRRIGGAIGPWAVGLVSLAQAVIAATCGLPYWSTITRALVLPVPVLLEVDFMSAVILFAIALAAAAAAAVSANYSPQRRQNFASLALMLMAGMNGVVMVRDLFSLYIFLEITAVTSFILISMNKKLEELEGAFKYFVLSGIATVFLIAANMLIFMSCGSLRFAEVGAAFSSGSLIVQIALVLYVAAFCVKAGVVPFHGWLPGSYTSAPDAVSVLLAGIVTKVAGVYVILRLMGGLFAGLAAPGQAFMILGAASIVIGAFAAIGQKNMKQMLAWSSISQVGYIILAAGLGTKLALAGALLHFFNHAVFKALLFVNAASVQEQCGSVEMESLGGLSEKMKVTGWTSVIGFLSTAGVPPLSGFWSKLLIIMALITAGRPVYAGIALLMSVVTLGYFLIMQHKVFFGKLKAGLEGIRESRLSLSLTSAVLAAVTVIIGVLFPAVIAIMHSYGLV